jgi:hypothetical protein
VSRAKTKQKQTFKQGSIDKVLVVTEYSGNQGHRINKFLLIEITQQRDRRTGLTEPQRRARK